jgi:hypothetical protein
MAWSRVNTCLRVASISESESFCGFESTEPPPGDGEAPEGGFGEDPGDEVGDGLCSGVGVGVASSGLGVGVTVTLGLGLGDGVGVGFGVNIVATMKYPAATIPIRSIGRTIKSQSLLPPPPGPLTTASDCPHSGQTGAPSKRIWSPV